MIRADQEEFLDWAYGHGEDRDCPEEAWDVVAYGRPIVRARQFTVVNRLAENPWTKVH
jgi:hypothetical protein